MASITILLVLVVLLAIAFDYINGFHDTANAVATVVSTNVLPGRTAVLMAGVFNFVGAFVGTHVAKTIGLDITDPASLTQTVVAAALLGAITWNLLTWYFGIPSSSSHALIGGIVGAVWCFKVFEHASPWLSMKALWQSDGVSLAVRWLVLSPILGLTCGFAFMLMLLWVVRSWRPTAVNRYFRVLQLVSAGGMAFSHGSNDAQKSMGIITMALAAYLATTAPAAAPSPDTITGEILAVEDDAATLLVAGNERVLRFGPEVQFRKEGVGGSRRLALSDVARSIKEAKGRPVSATVTTRGEGAAAVITDLIITRHDVPGWVIFVCATAMGLGTASGGWRIMKTMGHKIIKLRPINGFAAETAGAIVIQTATHFGAPVSTTHVIAASIMGVGASKRVSAVRWGVATNILWAWVLTIPISAVVSALTYALLRLFIRA